MSIFERANQECYEPSPFEVKYKIYTSKLGRASNSYLFKPSRLFYFHRGRFGFGSYSHSEFSIGLSINRSTRCFEISGGLVTLHFNW